MTTADHPWGRVDADGTVYVRTAGGERVIGSWQAGSPEEALAFYQRKYEALETEVVLLEQRITATDLPPAPRMVGGRHGEPPALSCSCQVFLIVTLSMMTFSFGGPPPTCAY